MNIKAAELYDEILKVIPKPLNNIYLRFMNNYKSWIFYLFILISYKASY